MFSVDALSKDLIMKLAIAYTERFSTLKTEYDAISKRMMVKLFAEQEARVELENRLYDEQVRLLLHTLLSHHMYVC